MRNVLHSVRVCLGYFVFAMVQCLPFILRDPQLRHCDFFQGTDHTDCGDSGLNGCYWLLFGGVNWIQGAMSPVDWY